MTKALAEMNEQEANDQFAQEYNALIERYRAAGFQIQHGVQFKRRYVLELLQGLDVPPEHLQVDVVFAVVKVSHGK